MALEELLTNTLEKLAAKKAVGEAVEKSPSLLRLITSSPEFAEYKATGKEPWLKDLLMQNSYAGKQALNVNKLPVQGIANVPDELIQRHAMLNNADSAGDISKYLKSRLHSDADIQSYLDHLSNPASTSREAQVYQKQTADLHDYIKSLDWLNN